MAKVDESLYEVRLDSYNLPSLMIKILKSMKKNGVVEVKTSRVDKLKTNFANTSIGFDQHALFKDDDQVMFRITLLASTMPGYFYKMKVADKLAHILRLKETATKFFTS